jgi:hypothetical protein
MKDINARDLTEVQGGYFVLAPVAIYVWYEFGGGKEFIKNL